MIDATGYFEAARERERIRQKREAGESPPWTRDKIFQQWRFCNVHREDDRVTRWFRENVRSKLTGHRVVLATTIFRWFNNIPVGERIKPLLLGKWDRAKAKALLRNVKPITSGAYMVNTPPGFDKLDGILECIEMAEPHLGPMSLHWGDSLEDAWYDLRTLPRIGSFVAYEIVTDLWWTDVLGCATDAMSWAAAGPGCAKGLGYLIGDPDRFQYTNAKDQLEMLVMMRELLAMSQDEKYWPKEWKAWQMRTVEHWCCEHAKYQNATRGMRLKRRFSYNTYSVLTG